MGEDSLPIKPRKAKTQRSRRRDDPPEENFPTAAWITGVVTGLIKIGGLVIAGNEALLNPSPHDPMVFALAGFMMAGAQGIDTFLNTVLGNRK